MKDHYEECQAHLQHMRTLAAFFSFFASEIGATFTSIIQTPHNPAYAQCIERMKTFNRTVYDRKDLYKDGIRMVAVDQFTPPNKISDSIKANLGHDPILDFFNFAYAQPFGTQLSFICLKYCWDSYDTFVKSLVGGMEEEHKSDARVIALKERRRAEKDPLQTDVVFSILQLVPQDLQIQLFITQTSQKWTLQEAKELLTAGKKLRTIFTHHNSIPSSDATRFFVEHPNDSVRIEDETIEVYFPLVLDVSAVVQAYANIIWNNYKSQYELPGSNIS